MMKLLPAVKRALSSSLTGLERVKKVVVGVAAIAALATGLMATTDVQASVNGPTAQTPVLLVAGMVGDQAGYHYSHSSHSSHSSHQSHQSHYSSRY
jgi:hypothetical protein